MYHQSSSQSQSQSSSRRAHQYRQSNTSAASSSARPNQFNQQSSHYHASQQHASPPRASSSQHQLTVTNNNVNAPPNMARSPRSSRSSNRTSNRTANNHSRSHVQSRSQTHGKPSQSSEEQKKYIAQTTQSIVETAGLDPKCDTVDLINRSVKQHVQYLERLKHLKVASSMSPQKIMDYIRQLTELENRENALSALSKLRENNPDLAPLLWGTPAVIAALLQEVISVYPYLSGNIQMNSNHSNRCCNALALLQCVASHPETRGLFLKAYIPLFLYPFLNTELNSRPFEYLRLTSLGVIGALVKHPHPNVIPNGNICIIPDSEVTEFLVKTEAIPLCLHIMEYGNELSQTVATFIIQKILLDNYGLNYVCKTSDRFFAISQVLTKMIEDPKKQPSKKLIKHVVRCYLRLCDDTRAYLALHSVLPKYLCKPNVEALIGDDEVCLQWLRQLRKNYRDSQFQQQDQLMRRRNSSNNSNHKSNHSNHSNANASSALQQTTQPSQSSSSTSHHHHSSNNNNNNNNNKLHHSQNSSSHMNIQNPLNMGGLGVLNGLNNAFPSYNQTSNNNNNNTMNVNNRRNNLMPNTVQSMQTQQTNPYQLRSAQNNLNMPNMNNLSTLNPMQQPQQRMNQTHHRYMPR